MGSACCVAAKDHTLVSRTGGESLHRDAVCSPAWSFRWDRGGRVAGEGEDPSFHTSYGVSRNVSMELKGSLSSERGNLSDIGTTLENSVTHMSQKSPIHEQLSANPLASSSDISMSSSSSIAVKYLVESPESVESSTPNLPFSTPSVFSTPLSDRMPNLNYHNLPMSTPSRLAHRSHPLLRQISDSRIPGLKSPDNSILEGRSSFVLSNCSHDMMATGSQWGSSDGWSMRTFSEMVASSQKGRWSFDSEYLGSGRHKISGTSSRFSSSPSMDLQACMACSKLLTERSAWSNAGNNISVVSVLVCGHVFHAECLETITPDAQSRDPVCPVCTVGENFSKLSVKGLRTNSEVKAKSCKIPRNQVVNSDIDGGLDVSYRQKDVLKMEASSSTRSSFLRRRFSLGSKWSRSLSENDSTRKKGFWARYRKD